ncbi:MAG: peptide chain release factor N(5)-glutamine methyltransferase [Burkholderiaceae bacterium]|nr:peptide chain release factor N(5)-glutamine methyltransferase [Burkholderiaceae bacterium]
MIDTAASEARPTESLSIAQALTSAAACGVDRLDAQWMLEKLFGQPRTWLIAHDDALLSEDQRVRYTHWISRRAAGEPLAYLFGEKEFHGLQLRVGPHVLIPRPDTETLVEWGLELLMGELSAIVAPQVVDLGTGSGAIALAIKRRWATAAVAAVDLAASALEVARSNADGLGLTMDLVQGSWWSALSGRRFHLALSNPPYIAPGDEHLAALRYEPQSALVSGENGLSDLHEIIDDAPDHLAAGGWLLLEHGHDQAEAVRQRLCVVGFENVQTRIDLTGRERCSGGRLGTRSLDR